MERTHFEEELRALGADLDGLATLAADAARLALRSLAGRDADRAREVIAGDVALSELERRIDDRAMTLLALQQPAARDLRLVLAAVKACTDLERIGDHAVNVAQTVLVLLDRPALATEIALQHVGQMALGMLADAVRAFAARDADLARAVLARDHEVDGARRDVFRQLLAQIRENPRVTEQCVSLMLVSRNIERIADHATNIAEDAIFLVSARDVRHMAEVRTAVEDAALS